MIATHNRVAPFLNPTPVAPPAPADRPAAFADAVFASVVALQGLLSHPDPAVVLQAAGMILDVEKTRLRHGRDVVGTGDAFAATNGNGTPDTAPVGRGEEVEESDEDRERVEFLQGWLQERADQAGERRRVSRTEAEHLYAQCRPHLADAGLHPSPG